MERWKCQRCGHEWWPRTPDKPQRCAKCKVKYWWRAARAPRPPDPPGPIGRPIKYPLRGLEVGESVLLPYAVGADRLPDEQKNHAMVSAVNSYVRRHRWEVVKKPSAAGLRVTRTA